MTPWPRAMNVTAVAQPSAGQDEELPGLKAGVGGRRSAAARRPCSVEVAELIVEALVERGIGAARRRRPARLSRCRDQRTATKPTADGAAGADQVREQPRQAVEALVDRRAEQLLAAVLRDEVLR